jgi:hypothetical protein
MYPEGPEMDDILVATAARPQRVDSDEPLGERQQQTRIPNRLEAVTLKSRQDFVFQGKDSFIG